VRRKRLELKRLRAAYQACGFGSWLELSKFAGVTHPTISRHLSRGSWKANPQTVKRLAKALQVQPEWLTGERKDLPFVPQFAVPGAKTGPSLWEEPSEFAVRFSWLMQRIETAILRDLDQLCGVEGRDAYRSWGEALLNVFSELSNAIAWRSVTLKASPFGNWDAVLDSDDHLCIKWLTYILEPWLVGEAYLNAGTLRGVYQALLGNRERVRISETRDKDALRALEQYSTVCRERLERRPTISAGREGARGSGGRRGKKRSAKRLGVMPAGSQPR